MRMCRSTKRRHRMTEIKECPFCGNSWGTPQIERHKEGRFFVGCMNPRCGGSGGFCDTEDEAIEVWNTRFCAVLVE